MNRLSTERRGRVIRCLVEGMSIRDTVRVMGVAKNTIGKLLEDLGTACEEYQHQTLRNLDVKRVEVDEVWSFCYSKQKNIPEEHIGTFGYGDVWTWTAIDADTKLVPSWLVGERTTEDCYAFLADLKARMLPGQRIQLTSDGLGCYPQVVDDLWRDGIEYAQIIKEYDSAVGDEDRKYSPAKNCRITDIKKLNFNPDRDHISKSYVERQNLTMRMGMRRFTRLTNGFSKKVENLTHAVSLHYMHYNFARPHLTLAKKYPELGKQVTPAIAAGVAHYPWTTTQIAGLLD